MGDGVVTVGVTAARPHRSQPEAAIRLKHQHRLAGSLAVGFQQGHAEFFSHLGPPRTRSQATQHRIHLRKGHERGFLRVSDQDHPVEPLDFVEQILNGRQQRWQRKGHVTPPVS